MHSNPTEQEIQALKDAFFAALPDRNFDICVASLDALRTHAEARPDLQDWVDYLTGILVNERDHDWALAARTFNDLLQRRLEPTFRGRMMVALGVSYFLQGRWRDAIGIYEQSVSLFEELGQPVEQAKAWKNIANCRYRGYLSGEFGHDVLHEAITHCKRALALLDEHPDQVWEIGATWNTLGLAYGCLNEWDAALEGFERHLEMCRTLDEPDWYGVGASYLNIGEIHHRRGPEAWPAAIEAYQQALVHIHRDPPAYDEMDVLANLGLLYQEMGDSDQALDYYQRAITCIETLRSSNTSADVRASFLATTIDTYAHMVLLHAQLGQAAAAFDYAEQARSRAFLEILEARASELVRMLSSKTLNAAEVQAALTPDTLLLAYFTTGLLEARDKLPVSMRRHRFPASKILLFAVTQDTIRVHDLGLSPNALQPGHLNNVVEGHFLDRSMRQTLYDRLLAPVADLLPNRRLVYIAPHGPLHYIPFQALVAPDGKTFLREPGPTLAYIPSATILFRPTGRSRTPTPETCLALAYNGEGVSRLKFGENEAESIARLLDGSILAGAQPKKADLYARAGNYRFLHMSCHGVFDPEAPLESALSVGAEESLTALDVIENMRLNSDLVCLSACESGLSRVRRGDELEGLTRAFFLAGTAVLVCSLWRVDERSTRILMERFYEEIKQGGDFADALKRAQIYLRNLRRGQVREILVRYFAEDLLHNPPSNESELDNATLVDQIDGQVNSYLKGIGTAGTTPASLPSTANDDEPIFADPFYWAPFILIGDSRSLSEHRHSSNRRNL
jgi:CHAT domain-containing protein/tetratricopeptide (TPR) repeat protein